MIEKCLILSRIIFNELLVAVCIIFPFHRKTGLSPDFKHYKRPVTFKIRSWLTTNHISSL